MNWSGVRLFVGGQPAKVQGEVDDMGGDRCFTPLHAPNAATPGAMAILDSGAFSDKPAKRLSPEGALQRQLAWETRVQEKHNCDWQAWALVSCDLLIDEVWIGGDTRVKRRWSVKDADRAVQTTVEAAHYLSGVRHELGQRKLLLSLQGVDAQQYTDCARAVLRYTRPGDIIGLGGWCILGRLTSWLPEFWATLYNVLPLIARAGVDHVHILGVLWHPALGGLLWLADQYGIKVSTDSSAPILACTWKNPKKAGVRAAYWRDNVDWWRSGLADLRQSCHYRQPPRLIMARQPAMEFAA